jgi:homoserine dehydrogenase
VRTANVGLLGCGVVGAGFVELLRRSAPLVLERSGVSVRIARVAVRDRARDRQVDREIVGDADALFADPSVGVVVELIGGIEPARTLVLRAIESGRHVVTANKALLAAHGAEILGAAARRGVRVAFEASVCGGLSVLRAITHGLVANRIDSVWGIVNGTSNFILSAMEDGATFDAALGAARACGFAEEDPSLDIDGWDALQKLQILVALAFGRDAGAAPVVVEGIRGVTRGDVTAARARGLSLRHLVRADRVADGLALSVGPVLLPERHPLAWSRYEFNAILVRGDAVGETVYTGRGAGPMATASAVLADVVDVATVPASAYRPPPDPVPVRCAADVARPFVVRLPRGAPEFGAIAESFARHGVRATAARAEDDGVRVEVAETTADAVRRAALDVACALPGAPPPLCIPIGGPVPARGGVRAA